MQISNVTQRPISLALWAIMPNGTGDVEALNRAGTRYRVKLTVKDSRGDYGRRGHLRRVDGERRRVAALCWHGFRDFLITLFDHAPYATVRTARATYDGVTDFYQKFPATGGTIIGSQADPLRYDEACDCRKGEDTDGAGNPISWRRARG